MTRKEAVRDFNANLYEEHLEEASFLYEQRLALEDDPELSWRDTADEETRLENHFKALKADTALTCLEHANLAEPGVVYVALRLCMTLKKKKRLQSYLNELDLAEYRRPMLDALSHGDGSLLIDPVNEANEAQLYLLTEALMQHGMTEATILLGELKNMPPHRVTAEVAGKSHDPSFIGLLRTYLADANLSEDIHIAAAKGLLRLEHALNPMEKAHLPLSALAFISGTARRLMKHPENPDAILALGIVGDPKALPVILNALNNEATAEAAALALTAMTGQEMREEVFVPETVDPDELFPEDLAAVEQGEPLRNPNGEPAGETISRISQSKEQWSAWIDTNTKDWEAGKSYRNGDLLCERVLLESLLSDAHPNRLRRIYYEEAGVRFDMPDIASVNQPVAVQTFCIEDILEMTMGPDGDIGDDFDFM